MGSPGPWQEATGSAHVGRGQGRELRRDKTAFGDPGGHRARAWQPEMAQGGRGGGFCGLSTKEKQVEASEGGKERDEGRSKALLFPVSASLAPCPSPLQPALGLWGWGWLDNND